jgi:DNA-binding transcriptional LysR family regulator
LNYCTKRHLMGRSVFTIRAGSMVYPDFNLLITLDVLLQEGSVARAARRLQLSPSAMSRALARLRAVTGDPLLVRAGRGLVPTPRALELRGRVSPLVEEASAVLRPVEVLEPARLRRTFSLRCHEGFVQNFGAPLMARIADLAPGVRLHFLSKPAKESGPLRDGSADMEVGVIGGSTGPEIKSQLLFRDRFIGVVRLGHPLLAGDITPERYAAARHILVSRRAAGGGPIDAALSGLGLRRQIATIVSGFSVAVALAAETDLIASVPALHTLRQRGTLISFALPFELPDLTLSLLWHPRFDADPAHRWMRAQIREVCGAEVEKAGPPGLVKEGAAL